MLVVSAIIPHAGGREILRECLDSLQDVEGVELEVVVVDNGSGENPDDWGLARFAKAQYLHYECRLGFAAACNRGVDAASGDFVFLFNNDAVIAPGGVAILAETLSADPVAAAVQPKILRYSDPKFFDYSSACGGMLDRYGIPFAKGRIFDTLEEDRGQYDSPGEIFWGAGAALMLRKNLYLEAGGLEEPFFAHMEEIDLLWRLQLMGCRVLVEPRAVVRHRGAVTIQTGSFLKLYLNHRNSLTMMLRNYSLHSLLCYFPARFGMDMAFGLLNLALLNFKKFFAVVRAWIWILFSISYLIECRRRAQRLRRMDDSHILRRIYPGSIAWQYFIRRRRTYGEIEAADLGRR